ncbi:alpha/beta hydrolase [Streptomyces scopuliridis]|uniref:Alpha/beta hydrolase n=1 Tax=Streptomyces scopuliridis TaxID=452529 RepID=A0ACD4ZJ00_9ACTN|nr:alpha/beta hydrolase [Streptomyces scopuliridis]WSB34197.1 alpha/beta hydrolase [Streptomyces scopuliridis]WSB98469.1 alpha/beta hydrolase [Streptomyces scopuliridis]WSC07829.1 alpha/beta hydrolase [Streptomyces scopuliridis]
MRRTLSLALAATAVVTAIAIPGVSVAETPDTVRWGPCPEEAASPRLECSTLEVPLDYRDPDGRQIEIAISRLASEKPSQRRGVLLTNPGGPGAGGLTYPALLAAYGLPQEVLDSYDVIGFDPRGVGRSTQVTCDLTPEQQARRNFPPYAHTAADVAREAGNARTIAKQCATSRTASMLPHTTTANTARDMDRIRAALGERKLSYLGSSYGTYLGAVYTTKFPKRSDRIVLDSNLGPGGYDVTAMRMFARGLEEVFPQFAAFAAAHPEYGLGTTPQQVTAKFFELAKRLEAKPVQGIDGTLFRGITFDSLYSDALMPTLAKTWQALDTDRPLPPNPPPANVENLMSSRFAVICGDTRWPGKVRDYQRNAAVDRLKYPMLGGSTASIGPCAFWPDKRVEPPVRIGDRGPSNVLMAQNERDPGTPLAGAQELRRAFGKRATMVTADQSGHGVYPFGRNTCANDAVTAFLTTGQRPAEDLACAAEPNE